MGLWCWKNKQHFVKLSTLFNLLLLNIIALLAACASPLPTPQSTGMLQGHVTIGPLVPVQREDVPDPTPAPEVYAARQIVIFSADGQTEIARAEINSQGNYSIELPSGEYLVDINQLGIDSADGLPTIITIISDGITLLDIDIDTGIR